MSNRYSARSLMALRHALACSLPVVLISGCAHSVINLNALRPAMRGTIGGLDVHLTIEEAATKRSRPASNWSHVPAGASAAGVLTTAETYIGVPYKYGGTTPTKGFDCSGFVQYVFARHGVELPRTSRGQSAIGQAGPEQVTALRPGDLMFFDGKGRGIDHVAIYVGQGRIIHASAGSGRVRYDDLDSGRGKWFLAHHVTSRRIL
jgi:cell wall-associated NlpC family hydrolase